MKIYLFAIVALCALISLTSALSTDIKQIYQPGETMVFELQGAVLEPLTRSNIEFLRGHVPVEFQHEILKLGSHYFIYALAPISENNYTFIIKDVVTLVNGSVSTQTLEQNFSVKGPLVDYTIKPGAVLAQEDTEFTLTLNADQDQIISIGDKNQSSVTLHPGSNKLVILFKDLNPGFQAIPIGKYIVPFYAVKEIPIPPSPPRIIYILPERIEETILLGHDRRLSFRIVNLGDRELTQIAFNYNSGKYTILPSAISRLGINESAEFNITLKQKDQNITDTIRITAGNESAEIPLNIRYTTNITTPISQNNTSNSTQQGYYCEELNGRVCASSEQCQGQVIPAINGDCCSGTCIPKAKQSYAWIGYLFAALVLMVLVIVGGRYWKTKHTKGDMLKKKTDEVEKKIYFFFF